MRPTNDLPNPYQTISNFLQVPEGRTWGSMSAVDIDKDGVSVWVAERCGTNACVGSTLDPVMLYDANGKFVRSFGSGMIQSPHGLHVDRDGNIWVVDCSCTIGGGRGGGPPPDPTKGHQVFKFSRDGKLLMTLGKPGGGKGEEYFTTPNAVITAPNGDIFVSEGHSSGAGTTARVLRFSKDGKFISAWGTGVDTTQIDQPYAFNQPHALALDSRGRLFVGDRSYNRIKIFDMSGKLLDTWYQFSRPSGIYIDKDDNIYVADSESQVVGNGRGREWKRGIRVGSAKDGSVKYFIPDPIPNCAQGVQPSPENHCANNTSAAEGVAVDSKGVIYGAEVGGRAFGPATPMSLKRYVKK